MFMVLVDPSGFISILVSFSLYPGHFPALVTSGALSQGKGAEL